MQSNRKQSSKSLTWTGPSTRRTELPRPRGRG
jgi:hypothetical protein